jgi:hypothetical protein
VTYVTISVSHRSCRGRGTTLSVQRRIRYLFASAVFLAGAVLLAPSGPVGAAGVNCNSAKTSYGDWVENPAQTSLYGVRGDIETNVPALCSASGGSPSSSSAWVMLLPEDMAYYAQAGYVKNGTEVTQYPTGFHYLAQYKKPDGSRPTYVQGDPGTSTHRYAVYLRASDDRIHMERDGNHMLTLDYDVTGVWDSAWFGTWSGETWHLESDVPGTYSDHTTFNYIQRFEQNGDINFVTSLTKHSASSRYWGDVSDATVGGKRFDIWTYTLTPP